jgi:hypothetical protein
VQIPLHHVLISKLHVVAQIIETEFIVRSVGHIRLIGFPPLAVVEPMDDTTDPKPEEAIDLSHPFAVAAGQVVIHRDQMHSPSRQRIEIDRHRGNEGLAFTRFHLGDSSLVQHDPTDDLDVEGAHPESPNRCFSRHGKGFRKKIFKGFPVVQPLSEFPGLGLKLMVAQFLNRRFKIIDLIHIRHNAFEVSLILTAKNLSQHSSNHFRYALPSSKR